MHELSIAISMVDQILEESRQRGGLAIQVVHLTLGQLSGVDKDALHFCYTSACDGTLLAGSRLVIDVVPVVVFCSACQSEGTPASVQQLACPRCSSAATVVRGFELEVAALEVAA
jgi:hydrogenase nickel incorporation protein HypA/HybF